MATDIDLKAVSTFSTVSEANLNSLLTSPTPETVRTFLENVQKNAKDCEHNKSQKVRLEVELETVVRTNESKVKVLQNSRDKALSDVQKLRSDLQQSENNRSQVISDLEQLRSSHSTDASETTTLKSRITSLESSNRDTLALLESKTNAYEKLSQDLSAQHQKASELRKQVASLEQASQSSNSAAASAKFREQGLQQEIDLVKKNNEWLENERKLKADEHTAFRKDKNARIAELSRSNEQYIADAEALKRSEVSLKGRLDDYVNKYEDLQQELQRIRDEKASDAESFRVELEGAQRLADLQKSAADSAKERLQVVEEEFEDYKEEAANELGTIRSDADQDHQEKEAAVRKITELESTVASLRADLDEQRQRPGTPLQPINGNGPSTPARPSTPSGIFTPSSKARNPTTQTHLYSEYKRVEKELAKERHEKDSLQKGLDEMVAQLEEVKPELDEIRIDNARLQSELLEMSSMLDSASREREEASRSSRLNQSQLDARLKEVEVLQQQIRDVNSQCRRLLFEIDLKDRGETITPDALAQLEQEVSARDEAEMEILSETQRVVNARLLAFKNISELQSQNSSQITTIRNLVERLESQEAKDKEEQFLSMQSELEAARAQIAGFQDEIKTMVAQSKSFVKERDMFRNMLARKGQLGEVTDFSRSLPVPPAGSPSKGPSAADTGTNVEQDTTMKEMKEWMDNTKRHLDLNQESLRKQVDDLSRRNSELQTNASRLQGQLSAATQRAESLQLNYDMLKTENGELQRRSTTAMENASKQELRVQHAAEDLIESKGLAESLQRESANLKAEKELWKNIEKRLVEDNETLRNERSRLDQLNSSLQNLHNEREQADSETRRRLQSQVESLENELQTTKRKLNDEQEDSRKASLRREYEQEQSQKRIDDLMTTLGSTREDLASTKTSRDHLQARVDELAVELRAAEERLEVYTKPAAPAESTQDDPISKEQELTLEISELKRELEHTKSELERATEQIDVYKNISQSAEERLQELGETNDQYREETEASIAEKDSKIKDLEQRVEDISSELDTTNSELSRLRDEQTDVDRRLQEQKTTFEGEIERLKDSEERASEQAQFNLEASKAQAQIATEAQQNYENELVKHADAARNLQVARSEANQLRLDAVDLKTKVETAQHDLQQKESSWSDLKSRYEQELGDLKKRREEVLQQNSLLHTQLEGLSQQISALQKDRAALSENNETESSSSSDLASLQEVIKYLRREKEIVDVQYHLSQQEAKRIRQQLDYAQSQLDDTRLKLDQERRSQADSERNAMSHNKLMETLNELNLFRESSVTLRAEAKQATQALAEKTKQVEDLEARIQPLQARVAELEDLVETRDGEHKIMTDDRDHWRQRTQDILSKYNRIDPAELEALKEQITTLEKERDETVAARDDLQAQVDNIPEQIKEAKTEQRNALGEQFKARNREMTGRLKDKQTEVDSAVAERDTLQQQLDEVREQLESARNHPPTTQVNGETKVSSDKGDENSGRVTELETKVSELESTITEKDQEIASLNTQKDAEVKAKEETLMNHLRKKMAEHKDQANKAKDAALQELRTQLEATHQDALNKLRTELAAEGGIQQPATPAEPAEEGEVDTSSAAQVISDEQMLAQPPERWSWAIKNVERLKNIIVQNVKVKVDKQVEAAKATWEAEQTGEIGATVSDAQIAQIRGEMEAALNKQQTDFATEKEAIEKQFHEKLEKDKEDLINEHRNQLESQKLLFSEESEKKIADQVQKAELMAEKKHTLKTNMANNKANGALAKLKVVETAASETPDRAVKEVWEEAKIAKPAPQPKPAAQTDAPPAASSTAQGPPPVTSTPEVAKPIEAAAAEKVESVAAPASEAPAAQPIAQQSETIQSAPNGPAKPNVGTGPAALRGISGLPRGSSSIPRGGGGAGRGAPQVNTAQRGGGVPRGRGGIPRGTRTASIGGASQRGGSVAGSPTRGALNPGASQFVPGEKRPREDGDAGAGGQKRIRGGGQGS